MGLVVKSIDVTLADHVIFWPRETATLLKSNLRYFHREKSTFEKFNPGLKLRIVFYTHKTIKTRRKNFRVIYTLSLSFLKKPLFQKRRWSCDFPPRKARLPKSTARFPVKKRWHSPPPVGMSWDFPPPPPESVRTDGRTDADVTTKIFRIDRQPRTQGPLSSSFEKVPEKVSLDKVSAGHVAPKIWVLTRMCYRVGVAKCKIVTSVRMVERTGGDVSFFKNICGDKNSCYRQVFLYYIRTFDIEAVHVTFDSEKTRLQVSEFQNTVANHRHSQRKPARVTT